MPNDHKLDDMISSFPDDGLLRRMPVEKRQRLIGEILSIFMLSSFHAKFPLGDILIQVLGAVDSNQFKLYRRKNIIVGYVSWAYLSDAIHEKYHQGQYRLRPVDWISGANGWIIDFIAPLGDTISITRDLRQNVFPTQTGNSFRVHQSHKGDGVRIMRGAKAAYCGKK